MSLAVTGATLDGVPVVLRTEDGRIAALGPDVEPRDGDEVLDGAGRALVPGLVNAHTHAAMTLFRGYGDDMPLIEWLEERIWPVEARLDDEDVYWGARLACLEMIRTGTVCFWDMYWRSGATARAVADAGLRATIGAPLIDRGGAPGLGALRETAAQAVGEVLSVDAEGRVAAALAPHSIYTVSEESLEWIAETAAAQELAVQIHLSETEQEVRDCVEANGERPAHYLDRVGLLGPRTIVAHAVWLDDRELDLLAEREVTVATNPVANMKLATGGPFRYPAARERGVRIGLGTDGASSNNSLDLLADAKVFALVQKHAAADPAAVTAAETWEIATGRRSPLLAGDRVRGADAPVSPPALAVGDPADFLLIRAEAPELTPGDLVANLVYAASGAVVDATVVAGRVLMRGGTINGADEVRRHALERARRLGIV